MVRLLAVAGFLLALTWTHPLCYAVRHGHSHHVTVQCVDAPPHRA